MGEFVGKELKSDVATEFQVFRLVDHTHAPAADLAEDAVMGNRLPHGLGELGHWVAHVRGGMRARSMKAVEGRKSPEKKENSPDRRVTW
jgi:hypothetical protein